VTRYQASVRALALGGAIVAADQATKALARGAIGRGERDPIFPGVALVNVRNNGVAFGLFEGGGALLIVFTAVAVAALLAFFYAHATRHGAWVPTGLLLGGATGNLIDRLGDEGVTDFIDLPLWPAFNLADIAITAGVLALLWVLEGPPPKARTDA
jgi:signal peptidase II